MKTNIETLAKILSVAIWADGRYDDEERKYISEFATALSLDGDQLQKSVEATLSNIEDADEDAVNAILNEASKDVVDDEKNIVIEASADIVLADGVLAKSEVENVLAITQALGVDLAEGVKAIISYITLPEKWTDALQAKIDSVVKDAKSEDALTVSVLDIAESVVGSEYVVER